MKVNKIIPNIVCIEYKQEEEDKDYGSCMYARFYFNLDRYELMIISDCGNYGYKWYETPNSESFLELMARCEKGYVLEKIYGNADIFDYEATKDCLYSTYFDDREDIEKLNEIFESMEFDEPETGNDFLRRFDEENDGYFIDTFEFPVYRYPSNALKIVSVFENNIKPKIKEILGENE